MIDEGYIKFQIDWTPAPPLSLAEIASLNRWRMRLFDAGLIGHYESLGVGFGNVSARIGDSARFVISATQTGHVAKTGPEHYALVTDYDIELNRVVCRGPRQASSESMTHAAIYARDPSTRAVVHVHEEAVWSRSRNSIPTTRPEAAYGTPEMARELARLYDETDFAALGVAAMAGHEAGLIAIGADIADAATRILELCRPRLTSAGYPAAPDQEATR